MLVYGKVTGGRQQEKSLDEGSTVRDLRSAMGLGDSYQAQTLDKEPVDLDDELQEDDFIIFSAAVKGGNA